MKPLTIHGKARRLNKPSTLTILSKLEAIVFHNSETETVKLQP
jgi:hypothetical protein